MRLRWTLSLLWCAAAATAAVSARRPIDMDFEFDDTAELSDSAPSATAARRPRRYVYDPHNPLCLALVCKKHALCVLRDAYTPLCASKKDILRKGDVIVSAGSGSVSSAEEDPDEVFYEAAAGGAGAEGGSDDTLTITPDRCVGCGGGGNSGGDGGGFLCGSDNRTYSSLCRLDLHNCVRRAAPPVALACRGFCPCRRARPRRPARRPHPHPHPAHNEVTPRRRAPLRGCALDKMADRLLDWFSVLMEEAEAAPPPPRRGFPADCKPEVRWMFAHLDTDGDGRLSAADLYALRHDERERCLRPFLASCGGAGGGGGGGVTRGAWCGCLRRAARPCTALARAHADVAAQGGYVPACDARGYYRARQCHAALGVCWCVDAHGTELAGSRGKGARACPGDARAPPPPPDDEDEDAGAAQGSGDEELRY